MPEILKTPESSDDKPRTSPITLAVGAVVVLAIAGSLWFLFAPLQNKLRPVGQGAAATKMSDAEQEYAKNLRFENLALTRAENFLHQEVTTLNGEVVNGGEQPVQGLFLTMAGRCGRRVWDRPRRCRAASPVIGVIRLGLAERRGLAWP